LKSATSDELREFSRQTLGSAGVSPANSGFRFSTGRRDAGAPRNHFQVQLSLFNISFTFAASLVGGWQDWPVQR
jgi:hypothetical protein